MKPIIAYFVDDKEEARSANVSALQGLLGTPEIKVEGLVPFPTFPEYDSLLATSEVGALFIDQRMRGGGVVNYDGIELAGYLRPHHSKLPIYILTGFPKSDFSGAEYRVEDILDKADIEIGNRNTPQAKALRARILRRLNVFSDILDKREQRFHDLLVKSLRETLTHDEEKELGLIETERVIPQQASELGDIKALEAAIGELRKRIHPNELF